MNPYNSIQPSKTVNNVSAGSLGYPIELTITNNNALERSEQDYSYRNSYQPRLSEISPVEIGHAMNDKMEKLKEAEDLAYFRAELVEMSPESFTLEEKRQILDDMRKSSSDIENAMRENFAKLDEVTQTRLLDSLGQSGYRDRDWWYRMLMDGPKHRDRPTF